MSENQIPNNDEEVKTEVTEERRQTVIERFTSPADKKVPWQLRKIGILPFLAFLALAVLLTAAICSFVFYDAAKEAIYNAVKEEQEANGDIRQKLEVFDKLYEAYSIIDNKSIKEVDMDKLNDMFVMTYLSMLDDRYAAYYTEEQMEQANADYSGSYVGIGIRTSALEDGSGIYITSIFKVSNAAEIGIEVGDIIVAVEGEHFTKENYDELISKIKGVAGTYVNITVSTAASGNTEEKEYSVELRAVEIESVEYKLLNDGTAFIRIYEFAEQTPKLFREAMEQSEKDGAKRYIFDVRNNPGGGLNSVSEVLDMLLPEGTIMTYKDSDGQEFKLSSTAKESLKKPAAVLVNGSTASAGELFTAALRDYNLATIVGVNTFGKGTMQTRYALEDGTGIKLTTAQYFPPCGINYDGVGIAPDVEIALSEEKQKKMYMLTPEEDDQIQAALKTFEK